jgi:RNA polymerase sigma-70 factor (ECF subfamily)
MSTGSDRHHVLEAAYRKYADYVFAVCLKFASGDRDWALDRAHDVFLRLDANLKRLQLDDELRPWLRKVAVNECLMDLRRRDRRRRLLGLFGHASQPEPVRTEHELAVRRDVVALDRAVGGLPARQRVLLGLMYFEGQSLTDAARLIGVSKGQASKLHKRALDALSQHEWECDA